MLHRTCAALKPNGEITIVDFERVSGESSDWVLEHVRVGKADVIAELAVAGFELIEDATIGDMKNNYTIRLVRK